VHHIGYPPNPWAWAPWEYAPFDGRWDDPEAVYRVLYTASSAEACFVEVLAPFRADPELASDLAEIRSSPQDEDYPTTNAGVVSRSWCDQRRVGTARLAGEYVDVTHSQTIAALRPVFAPRAVHYDLPDFDAAAIRLAEPRAFTMEISRYLYGVNVPSGDQAAGVAYRSRHGDEYQLWAVFERTTTYILSPEDGPISPDDPGLLAALALHGLVLS
jgi:hypothetical protein